MFQDCYFSCEYHGGHIALRDLQGLYLAPIGSRAVLKTRSKVVTKDELFSLEDSLPQASFVAASNTRYVSVKQGMFLSLPYFTSSVPRGLASRVYNFICTQFLGASYILIPSKRYNSVFLLCSFISLKD